MDAKYYLILSTAPNINEAKTIARSLVDSKLVACVNIIPEIMSVYTWKGEINEDNECILFMKTKKDLVGPVIDKVKEIHSYECPEIISIPIEFGHEPYLKWIDEVTS
ncbi:MAG: divalent-cation tolerance protein CutA [Promethearchaeota archaeon]